MLIEISWTLNRYRHDDEKAVWIPDGRLFLPQIKCCQQGWSDGHSRSKSSHVHILFLTEITFQVYFCNKAEEKKSPPPPWPPIPPCGAYCGQACLRDTSTQELVAPASAPNSWLISNQIGSLCSWSQVQINIVKWRSIHGQGKNRWQLNYCYVFLLIQDELCFPLDVNTL